MAKNVKKKIINQRHRRKRTATPERAQCISAMAAIRHGIASNDIDNRHRAKNGGESKSVVGNNRMFQIKRR